MKTFVLFLCLLSNIAIAAPRVAGYTGGSSRGTIYSKSGSTTVKIRKNIHGGVTIYDNKGSTVLKGRANLYNGYDYHSSDGKLQLRTYNTKGKK